jgi:hypothetical protein
MEIGPRTARVLDEVWQSSLYRADESLVFCHPALGTPLDPTKLSRDYMPSGERTLAQPSALRRRGPPP